MMQEYVDYQFDKDKEEIILWLEENLTYGAKHMTYLMNMLNAIKNLIEEWKRE